MNDGLVVSIIDLRHICEELIAHLEATVGSHVTLHEDMFWAIPPSKLYDLYSPPDDLTVGQLSESWTNLVALLADESLTTSFALVWLADILRAIGTAVVR